MVSRVDQHPGRSTALQLRSPWTSRRLRRRGRRLTACRGRYDGGDPAQLWNLRRRPVRFPDCSDLPSASPDGLELRRSPRICVRLSSSLRAIVGSKSMKSMSASAVALKKADAGMRYLITGICHLGLLVWGRRACGNSRAIRSGFDAGTSHLSSPGDVARGQCHQPVPAGQSVWLRSFAPKVFAAPSMRYVDDGGRRSRAHVRFVCDSV